MSKGSSSEDGQLTAGYASYLLGLLVELFALTYSTASFLSAKASFSELLVVNYQYHYSYFLWTFWLRPQYWSSHPCSLYTPAINILTSYLHHHGRFFIFGYVYAPTRVLLCLPQRYYRSSCMLNRLSIVVLDSPFTDDFIHPWNGKGVQFSTLISSERVPATKGCNSNYPFLQILMVDPRWTLALQVLNF